MTASPDNKDHNPNSGNEIFEQILTLNTQGIDLLLKNMFNKLADEDNWNLPERERRRLIDQIDRKKRIIKSSFVFQLKKNFSDFKSIRKTRLHENNASDWQALGLVGANEREETEALEAIIRRYEKIYDAEYHSMARRLNHCINRSRSELKDNPMHVKRLYESFQYSIDSLGLETRHKIMLYKLFANTVIERLEPLYKSVEQCFIEHNVLPDLKPMSKTTPTQESKEEPVPKDSVAMSRIPVLLGIFQAFKEKSAQREGGYSNLFPELKNELEKRDIADFDHLLDRLATKFDMVFSDDDLPERIKAQIARLQIYFFMSSIQESDLLKRSSNPARRLLDTIVRTEVDFAVDDQEEQSGFEYLRDQIDQINHNPFIESQIYAELLEGYIQYTSDREKNKDTSEVTEDPKVTSIDNFTNKVDSKPNPVSIVTEPELRSESELESEFESESESESKTEIESESESKIVAEAKAKSEIDFEVDSETVLESKINPEPEIVPVPKPVVKQVEEKPISMVEAVVKAVSAALPSRPEKPEKPSKNENIYAVVQSIVNDMTLPLRIQGRSLILFDEVWSPLLLEVAKTKGFKSSAWNKIMTIAKTQVWVLTPKSTEAELDRLVSATAQVEKSLSQSMQSLKLSIDQQASLLEFLEHEQSDVIAQTRIAIRERTKETKSNQAPIESSDNPEPEENQEQVNLADTIDEFSDIMDTGRFESSDDMLEALDGDTEIRLNDKAASPGADDIHKGDWIEIKQGNATVLAKLTWKSDDRTQFIFVDREGNRVCEINKEDLDKELEAGSMSLISSIPASTQRAAFSIIQTIK